MLIAEELLLLSIDETGKNALLGNDKIVPALGGALLAELALMERIGVSPSSEGRRQPGRVTITSTTPTDDQELDNLLAVLEQREGAKVSHLIGQMSLKPITKGLRDRLLERLIRTGVSASNAARFSGFAVGRRSIRGRAPRCVPACRPHSWAETSRLSEPWRLSMASSRSPLVAS